MSHLGLTDCWGTNSSAVDKLFTSQSNGTMERVEGKYRVVRVTEHSAMRKDVVDVLARGECGTSSTAPDPLLDWVYGNRAEDVYKPLPAEPTAHRLGWFRFLADFMVQFGCLRGGTYALVDPETRKVVAATVTAPPYTVHSSVLTCHQKDLRKAGMGMAVEVLTHPRMKTLGIWQDNMQNKLGLGNKHLNVIMFATAPESQNRGCGSALLRFLGEVADADGVPSLLETAGTKNMSFYASKGGYEEYARQPVKSFTYEGGGVGMRRPARK